MKFILPCCLFLLSGCDTSQNMTVPKEVGVIDGRPVFICTVDGCQYINLGNGTAHKGDCTNSIHIYNKK